MDSIHFKNIKISKIIYPTKQSEILPGSLLKFESFNNETKGVLAFSIKGISQTFIKRMKNFNISFYATFNNKYNCYDIIKEKPISYEKRNINKSLFVPNYLTDKNFMEELNRTYTELDEKADFRGSIDKDYNLPFELVLASPIFTKILFDIEYFMEFENCVDKDVKKCFPYCTDEQLHQITIKQRDERGFMLFDCFLPHGISGRDNEQVLKLKPSNIFCEAYKLRNSHIYLFKRSKWCFTMSEWERVLKDENMRSFFLNQRIYQIIKDDVYGDLIYDTQSLRDEKIIFDHFFRLRKRTQEENIPMPILCLLMSSRQLMSLLKFDQLMLFFQILTEGFTCINAKGGCGKTTVILLSMLILSKCYPHKNFYFPTVSGVNSYHNTVKKINQLMENENVKIILDDIDKLLKEKDYHLRKTTFSCIDDVSIDTRKSLGELKTSINNVDHSFVECVKYLADYGTLRKIDRFMSEDDIKRWTEMLNHKLLLDSYTKGLGLEERHINELDMFMKKHFFKPVKTQNEIEIENENEMEKNRISDHDEIMEEHYFTFNNNLNSGLQKQFNFADLMNGGENSRSSDNSFISIELNNPKKRTREESTDKPKSLSNEKKTRQTKIYETKSQKKQIYDLIKKFPNIEEHALFENEKIQVINNNIFIGTVSIMIYKLNRNELKMPCGGLFIDESTCDISSISILLGTDPKKYPDRFVLGGDTTQLGPLSSNSLLKIFFEDIPKGPRWHTREYCYTLLLNNRIKNPKLKEFIDMFETAGYPIIKSKEYSDVFVYHQTDTETEWKENIIEAANFWKDSESFVEDFNSSEFKVIVADYKERRQVERMFFEVFYPDRNYGDIFNGLKICIRKSQSNGIYNGEILTIDKIVERTSEDYVDLDCINIFESDFEKRNIVLILKDERVLWLKNLNPNIHIEYPWVTTTRTQMGSEFDNVIFILPNPENMKEKIIPKDIYISGITRARKRLFIIGPDRVFEDITHNNKLPEFSSNPSSFISMKMKNLIQNEQFDGKLEKNRIYSLFTNRQ